MTTENNPFMAPQAGAAEAKREGSGSFIPEGRNVPAGNGVNWLGSGWEMFKKAPGPWIGLTVVYIIMLVVLGMIPLVNAGKSCHQFFGSGIYGRHHVGLQGAG